MRAVKDERLYTLTPPVRPLEGFRLPFFSKVPVGNNKYTVSVLLDDKQQSGNEFYKVNLLSETACLHRNRLPQ